MTAAERGRLLASMGRLVLEKADELARLEALDVGKPLRQAKADALALARYLEFYGGAADKLHGETIPYQQGYTVLTLREPHGVTGHIVPWNYPMQIIGRSVGAALAMGNATVLKPAEEACLTALAFARRGAVRPWWHRPYLLHGLGRDRHPGAGRRGPPCHPRHPRARRQIAPGRLRRCRSRCRPALPRQCRHPERWPDLLRGLADPDPAADP
jgi:hypothetical protein